VISKFFCCAKFIQTYPKTPPAGKFSLVQDDPGKGAQLWHLVIFGWTKFGKKTVEMDHFFETKSGRFNKALQNIKNDPQDHLKLFILDVFLFLVGEWPNPNEKNLSLF